MTPQCRAAWAQYTPAKEASVFKAFEAGWNAALAIEAQRAETAKTGSVEDESAGPQDNAK